jgi:hypothetical protein
MKVDLHGYPIDIIETGFLDTDSPAIVGKWANRKCFSFMGMVGTEA